MKIFLFNNKYFPFLFIIDLLLIILILFISVKIYKKFKKEVLGVQYATEIKKKSVLFPGNESGFKYFYEPYPDSKNVENPEWLGYSVENKINSDSLIEEKEYKLKKDNNIFRILTLGDSFTYGLYVKNKDSYPKILENKLNSNLKCPIVKGFEVINLGVGGYDINYTVERFEKRGLKYNSDLIIWLINSWNIDQNVELAQPIQRELLKKGILLYDPIKKEHIQNTANEILREKYSLENINEFQISRIKYLLELYKKEILIASMPHFPEKFIRMFKSFEDKNIKYFDSVFNTYQNEKFRVKDDHPNELGHIEIAKSIYTYLIKNYFVNCSELKND